jgi:autotransporter translocation and assembly factor TamB
MAVRLSGGRRERLARVWHVVGGVILGPILVGLAVVAGAVLYARTDAGRERVRRLVLDEAHKSLPGLELGRIDGDYLHELRLVNVTVRDREGRAAIHADAIVARFDLRCLLRRTIVIDQLRVDGARVLARPAADGRLNLAELTTPAPTRPTSLAPAKPAAPWHVRVDRLEVEGKAEVELAGGLHATVRALRLVASLGLDGADVRGRVDTLTVDLGDAGRLSLEATASGEARPGGVPTLAAYDLVVTAADLDPEAVGAGPQARLGFTLAARGHGVPMEPGARADATIDVARSEVAGIAIGGGRLVASATGPKWELARATLAAAGTEVEAHGAGEGARVDGELQVTLGARLAARAIGAPAVAGHGDVTAHVTGTYPALVVVARGDVSALQVAETRVKAATFSARLEGPPEAPRGALRFAARGVVPPGRGPRLDRATVTVALERGALVLDAAVVGPRVRGGVRAHGVATADRADVTIDAASVDFATQRYRQVASLLTPTRVRFEAARALVVDRTALRGSGYLFSGDAVVAAKLRLLPDGALPRGDVDVSLRQASLRGQPRVDADAHVTLAERRATAKLTAALAGGGATVSLDASVPLVEPRRGPPRLARTGPIALHLDARCVHLEALPILDKQLARQGITGGVAHLSLDVTGDLAHPDAKGTFDLRDVTYRKIRGLGRDSTLKTIPGLGGSLALETSPGATRVRGAVLIRGAGVLEVDGQLALDPGELIAGADARRAPLRVSIDVPTFELGSLADFVDELQGVGGKLTAHGEISGSVARPSGTVDARVVNGKVDAVAFKQVALHAASDAGRVEGTFDVVEVVGGSVSAKARLDRAAGDRIDATLVAHDLDLGFARVFVPTLRETAGIAQLSARASGTLAAPELHASLDIEKGRLGIVGQPTFRDIRVQATLEPGRADLHRLEMRSGDGTLSGTAWVTLDGFRARRAVLTAHAHRFLVAAAGSTGARLDGDLALEGALRADVLSGAVTVPSAEVWLPKTPSATGGRDLQKIGAHADVHFVDETARAADERRQAATRDAATRAARRPVAVDIHVRAGPLYVRSKDLDLELESTLKVGRVASGARAGQSTLAGGIHIRRGHINIQGQRFDFDPGDITFDGGPDLTPALSIRLEHQYPDARIVIALEGTPAKPILHLTSEPPLYDQAQIVSLILTGQPGGQPSSGSSFDPTAAVATAVLGRLADEIAPQLGLDVLRVENVKQVDKEGYATGDTDTRVEVGKYISDRVYLSYAHVFAAPEDANQNEAQVEYRLTRRWMLESVFGDAGVGGVDALWTYRY